MPRLVRSVTTDAYSYVTTPGHAPGPGSSSASIRLKGAFWAIGNGDPALGVGRDNGSFAALVASGTGTDGWVPLGPGYGAVISTTWAVSQEIDGCIDDVVGQRCMAVLLSDRDAAGTSSRATTSRPRIPSWWTWRPGPAT